MKKKAVQHMSTCGECMQPIDIAAVWAALKVGKEYVHACGKVLVAARP